MTHMTAAAPVSDRFRKLVEGAPDALVALDRLGRVVYATASVTGLLGWTPAELAGHDPITLVHSGDVERVRRIVADVLATPGLSHVVEVRCRARDGELRTLEAAAVNRLKVPGLAVVVLSLRDVTGRRRAEAALWENEEWFRELAENLDAAFWIREVDPPRLVYVSPGFARAFDVTPREVAEDPFVWLERVHPDDRAGLREAVLAQAEGGYDREYRIVHRDGSTRWIRSRAFPIPGSPESVRRVAGISFDVTEQKLAAAQLAVQAELVSNLLSVARATTERPTLEGTLQSTLDVVKSVTAAEGASLFLLDEAGAVVESLFSHEHLAPLAKGDEARRIMTQGLAGWVARNRRPALVADTSCDERWLVLPGEVPMRSALCVPIASGAGLVGVLTLVHGEPGHFGPRHLELLRAAGDQMALALRNAQFVETLSSMATRERLLHEVLRGSALAHDREELLEGATRAIVDGTRWRQVALHLPDPAERERIRRASLSGDETTFGTDAARRAFSDARTQVVRDTREGPGGSGAAGSEVATPLRRGEKVLGVLDVRSESADDFPPEDVRLLESLADTVALAVENVELLESLACQRERLDALIQASRGGVLMFGPERAVLVINEPAIRLLGLAGGVDDWLRRPLDELGESLPAPLLCAFRPDDTTEEEGTFEVGVRRVSWRSAPVRTVGGPIGRLVFLHEVAGEPRPAEPKTPLSGKRTLG